MTDRARREQMQDAALAPELAACAANVAQPQEISKGTALNARDPMFPDGWIRVVSGDARD